MNAGSFSGFLISARNFSTDAVSGLLGVNGTWMKAIPACFAAAASPSMLAVRSVGSCRSKIDLKPRCFSSATASGLMAPPQATVVSTRAKFVMPGTSSLVTWAPAGAAAVRPAAKTAADKSMLRMWSSFRRDRRRAWKPPSYAMRKPAETREKAACAAVRSHENPKPANDREGHDPITAAQIEIGGDGKVRAESHRNAVDELDADVVRRGAAGPARRESF